MRHQSVVAWRGKSLFNGQNIMLLLTGLVRGSENEKTGPMVQSFILRSGIRPLDALRERKDRAICGDCKGRKQADGSRWCYVAPLPLLGIGRRMAGEGYPEVLVDEAAQLLEGRALRVGAYGDPAAVPFEVWQALLARVASWTGYTHAWRTCDPRFSSIVMASCDNVNDYYAAVGWRSFRAKLPEAGMFGNEVYCPADSVEGVQCIRCSLCKGDASPAKNVMIDVHGNGVAAFRARAR